MDWPLVIITSATIGLLLALISNELDKGFEESIHKHFPKYMKLQHTAFEMTYIVAKTIFILALLYVVFVVILAPIYVS
jgi:hypothetical protein